jgi:hypothetical protein
MFQKIPIRWSRTFGAKEPKRGEAEEEEVGRKAEEGDAAGFP